MKKICREVSDDYPKYERLLLGDKRTEGIGIYVSVTKSSSSRWKVNRLPVEHIASPSERSKLHTEVSCHEEGNFKFLLFASDFLQIPLVNFDSQGAAHRNKFNNVPFPQQVVTTPHFNRYDEHGRRYAYKTSALLNPEAAVQLAEIGNCVIHFYDEFNIHHAPAGYPEVHLRSATQQELFSIPTNDDPLAYVAKF